MGRLQTPQERRRSESDAAVAKSKETVKARAARHPAFRVALLGEAVEAFVAGDVDTGKTLIRDYINATVGFDRLGEVVSIDPKNLMRMFGPRGNPALRTCPPCCASSTGARPSI